MTIYKKDLQALIKGIKVIDRKIEKLIKEFDSGKKTKVAPKTKSKSTRLKNTTKKAPNKRTPASKKPVKITATDIVLGVVMAQNEGISVATLIRKTRFSEKKIQNILYRAKKKGKIKRVKKGIFIGVRN
jgi:predicted Rossmann fold nucleotide-binding protein DprA/Smf involved in DNA uptake